MHRPDHVHGVGSPDALDDVMTGSRHTVLEAAITSCRKDGKDVTVPYVSILERNDSGKVTELRVHIDMAPVFA